MCVYLLVRPVLGLEIAAGLFKLEVEMWESVQQVDPPGWSVTNHRRHDQDNSPRFTRQKRSQTENRQRGNTLDTESDKKNKKQKGLKSCTLQKLKPKQDFVSCFQQKISF